MRTCALLTTRCSLRRRLPLSASRWALVAALGLSVALLAWSDRAAAQSTSSVPTGAASGPQSAGNATGSAGTKINLDSLMRQQTWGVDLAGSDVHVKERLPSQGETPRARNGSAGGAPSETVRRVPQRRARASDEDSANADDADDGSARDVPPELQAVQKPPFGNFMFSADKH